MHPAPLLLFCTQPRQLPSGLIEANAHKMRGKVIVSSFDSSCFCGVVENAGHCSVFELFLLFAEARILQDCIVLRKRLDSLKRGTWIEM